MAEQQQTVRSIDDLMRSAADATLAVSWARRSRWRGTWNTTREGKAHATVNGSIHLTPEQTRDLQDMLAGAGRQHDDAALVRYRAALQAMFREHSRLLERPGRDRQRAQAIADRPWARVLDQGVAELWAARNFDAFVDRLGLEDIAPRLKAVQAEPEYAREAAAAAGLTSALTETWNGWPPQDVEVAIHRRAPHQRLEWLVESWYESRELEFLVPPHSQHVSIGRVERALRESLDRVDGVPEAEPREVLASCREHGSTAIRAAGAQLDALRKEYDNPELIAFLTHRARDAVLKLSGAGQSAHDGAMDEMESGGAAMAAWDGRLHLSNKYVVQHLREMYANAGQQHDEKTLQRYRWAVGCVLHEAAHFAIGKEQANGDAIQSYRHSARPYTERKWLSASEEGFVEAFNSAYLDDFIKDLEIDKVAPGILEVESAETYPSFAPASRAVGEGLDERTGMPREAVRRQAAASPREQWEVLADQMFETSRLPELVPPADREWVKRQIGDSMRTHFAWLDENTTWLDDNADPALDDNPKPANLEQTRELSTLRGQQAFQAGVYTMESLEKLYSSPTAKALYESRLAANRALAPASNASFEPEPRKPPRTKQWEADATRLFEDSGLPNLVPKPDVFHVKRAISLAMADAQDQAADTGQAGRVKVEEFEELYSSENVKALFESVKAARLPPAAAARPAAAPAQEEASSRYPKDAAARRRTETPVRGG